MLYIGVDLGTSAVKLLLMDEKGGIKKIVSKEYELHFPHPDGPNNVINSFLLISRLKEFSTFLSSNVLLIPSNSKITSCMVSSLKAWRTADPDDGRDPAAS